LAKLLSKNRQKIIDINHQDVKFCSNSNEAMLERLKLDDKKISNMITSINNIIAQVDPEGKLISSHQHKNGLKIENKSVAFGTVLLIYESRPDVTIEAAIVAFKAGNKIVLKGGKEAINTNLFLVKLWQKALSTNKQDINCVSYLNTTREKTQKLIKSSNSKFDLIIPRGGKKLIDFVLKNSSTPVLVSGRGNNFLYVDKESDFDMARKIILNGKQKLSACNALDKVLINKNLDKLNLKITSLIESLNEKNITVYKDDLTMDKEFLSAKIVIRLVKGVDDAISIINKYSGKHSASIVTKNKNIAKKFLNEADCAAVYHNASTRFTDGGEFGLGSEVAISTQKLHARGPIGLNQLVTNKWFIYGNGQIRI